MYNNQTPEEKSLQAQCEIDATESHKAEIRQQIADVCCVPADEITGNVREALNDIDGNGINVYWGAIPDEILNSNF